MAAPNARAKSNKKPANLGAPVKAPAKTSTPAPAYSTTNPKHTLGSVVKTNAGDYHVVAPNTPGAKFNEASGNWSVLKNAPMPPGMGGTPATGGGLAPGFVQAQGGKAPANQPIGTIVKTNGGNFEIVAPGTPGAVPNPETGYWSKPVNATPQRNTYEPWLADNIPRMTSEQLTKDYGLNYDFNNINKLMQDAITQKYGTLDNEMKQNENKFFDEAYGFQQDMLGNMQMNKGSAVTGSSTGAYMANDLLATLGWGQQTSDLSTTLVQDRQELADKRAADMAMATRDALTMSNEGGMSIGNLAAMFGANDAQNRASDTAGSAQMYASDQDRIANIYSTDGQMKMAELNRLYGGGGSGGGYSSGRSGSGRKGSGFTPWGSGGGKDDGSGAAYGSTDDMVLAGDYGSYKLTFAGEGWKPKEIESEYNKDKARLMPPQGAMASHQKDGTIVLPKLGPLSKVDTSKYDKVYKNRIIK